MKTFNEWLKLQEGKFDRYPSAYDGGNIERLAKDRVSGLSYGGRSLADKYGSYLRPLTDDFHPTTGMLRELSQATQQQVIKTLERSGLVLSRHGNRFDVKDDEGNMAFSSSNISDLVKTLHDTHGSGDDNDMYHNNAGIRANAIRKMELRDKK
jgi:hypothetical protein